jgi:hypothetical protein
MTAQLRGNRTQTTQIVTLGGKPLSSVIVIRLYLGQGKHLFMLIFERNHFLTESVCDRNDYPIWRRYDWALAYDSQRECIILSGRMVTVVSAEKEASEKV